jgi:hypothetical protein
LLLVLVWIKPTKWQNEFHGRETGFMEMAGKKGNEKEME